MIWVSMRRTLLETLIKAVSMEGRKENPIEMGSRLKADNREVDNSLDEFYCKKGQRREKEIES